MNNSTYRFTLDLHKHNSQMSIAVYKYDNAVTLYIGLTDGGKPYEIAQGSYAVFYGKRADGKALIHKCEIKDNTEIIYDFRNSTAYKDGVVDCQIRIYDGEDKLITAPRFTIMVEERVVDEDDVEISGDDALQGIDDIVTNEYNRQLKEATRDIAENGVFDQDGNLVTPGRVQAEEAREKAEKERKSVWVRYSGYSDGRNSTDKWSEGQDYIGVALSHDEPTDNSQYAWMLFKGAKGDQGIQGKTGEPFRVVKQYKSFGDMRDDFGNKEVPSGSFVMIVTSDLADDDNGKLYCKGETSWNFITDMAGAAGLRGEAGLPGKDGVSVTHEWVGEGKTTLKITSASGTTSTDLKGDRGDRGFSAFDIAKANGYKGTDEKEWVESLKGKDGNNGFSAYEIARSKGYKGTEDEWVESLKGTNGTPGKSAYQIARENTDHDIGTAKEWVESLKGTDGKNGNDGRSAFKIAQDNGYLGTDEATWVNSLNGTNGKDGESAFDIACKYDNYESESAWLASLHGNNGKNGLSAFELAGGYEEYDSVDDWLATLHGSNGKSAYEIANKDSKYVSEEEWLESLKMHHDWDGTTLRVTSGSGTSTSESLKGDPGASAYQVAQVNGFQGDEKAWLKSLMPTHEWKGTELHVTSGSETSYADLKGNPGDPGASAFEIAQSKGFKGDEAAWLKSLMPVCEFKGTELHVTSGSVTDFANLKGDTGVGIKSIDQTTIATEDDGTNIVTVTTTDEKESIIKIQNGSKGVGIKSIEQTTTSTEDGGTNIVTVTTTDEDEQPSTFEIRNGSTGKSAYEIANKDNKYASEDEWLDTLNGYTKQILTTDGELMRVFVGTQAKYKDYVAANGENNLFALITDDPNVANLNALADAVAGVINGTTTVPKAANADKASQDGQGNVISDTYATKTEVSNLGTLTITKHNKLTLGWSSIDNQYYVDITVTGFLPAGKTYKDIFMISGNFVFSESAGEVANRVVAFTNIVHPMPYSNGTKYLHLPFSVVSTDSPYYQEVYYLIGDMGVSSTRIYFRNPVHTIGNYVRVVDTGTNLSHISNATIVYV